MEQAWRNVEGCGAGEQTPADAGPWLPLAAVAMPIGLNPLSLLLGLSELLGREPHGLLHCASEPRSTTVARTRESGYTVQGRDSGV